MKRIACVLIAWLVLTGLASAQVSILGETKVEQNKLVRLKADGADPKAGVLWRVYPPTVDKATTGKGLLEFVAAPGAYRVELLAITLAPDGTTVIAEAVASVVIGGDPKPDPKPPEPGPGPKPDPAPIPDAGFRVLMIYETAEVQSLPPAQSSVLFSKQVRDYLDKKCATGRDGKTKEWRIWDKDIDTAGESKAWQAAMSRKRESVPWIVISNGSTGYEGPLPANVADALSLLKKYGGE